MNKFLDIKYVRIVNLLFCLLYVVPMVFLIIYSSLNKNNYNAKIFEINYSNKYKQQITQIKLNNNKSIDYKFMFNFFDQNEFLDLNEGDIISYSISKESLVEIENKRNKNKLSIIYFILTDYYGYFILLNVLMGIYNMITYMNFNQLSIIHKFNKTGLSRKDKFNNWTKKNPILTFLALALIIYLLHTLKVYIRSKQEYLSIFFIYKYLILYIPFIIILPYIILNFKNYKMFNQKNLLN